MSEHGSRDPQAVGDVDPPHRWADAAEWITDSATSLWGAFTTFARSQLRSGKKLALWVILAFLIATFIVAWLTVGTASEPTGCEGLQAITEPDCQ